MTLSGGTVKLVLSGDSVVLRGAMRGNAAPAERTLSLAFISAPRLGSSKKDSADEDFSLESREYLRRRVAGKAVRFSVAYTTSSGREFGHLYVGPDMEQNNAALMVVREGWARVSDAARSKLARSDTTDADRALIEDLADAEKYARAGRRGMWDEAVAAKAARPRLVTFEADSAEFLAAHRGRELRGTVEMVRSAASLRVMLHLPHAHQMVTVALAGVRAPGVAEPFGAEARFNVELRLLQQDVRVRLAAAGSSAGTFVGSVAHPGGNIAEWLVASGFARVQDWSAAHTADPQKLRGAERAARDKRLRVWHNDSAQEPAAASDSFDATVVRIVSGDSLVVADATGAERELQLASVRQPRAADSPGYADLARDALRRLCIGKAVHVTVDYHKPAADGFHARDCATVRVRGDDMAAQVVRLGLLLVIRHRGDDDARSANYDELQDAEAQAVAAKAGIHSAKPAPVVKLTDASESQARARSFLPHWQRSGRVPCVVEHVAAGSRLRLVVPKESSKLAFVLAGIRCPRAPRQAEQPEPWGAEALMLAQRVALQRNAEFEVEGVDKAGAFIGTLWLAKDQSLAEDLLRAGLASVHSFSADQSPRAQALYAAERQAKEAQRGMWSEKKEEVPKKEEKNPPSAPLAPRTEFLDVVVSELSSSTGRFFVQIAQPDNIAGLESLMAALAVDHNKKADSSADFAPKPGQLVAACYSVGNEWHRARVIRPMPGKREYELLYVDFGNEETVPVDRIRPLSPKFSALAPQAHEAQLAFLTLPSPAFAPDYAADAIQELRARVEGRQLVANVEARPHNAPMHLTLYDPELGRPLIEKSVNALIATAGFAVSDPRALSSLHNQQAAQKIDALVAEARNQHRGMWEYGDVTTDE
ncbi:hypothetical protein GGI20_002378 [Coemansia sp. BCRC 34301]|nr:hypothetical protein GGI20_002378 [Coemansia sp. BCRC 34301]